jgi:hypothetical protein
MGLTLFTCLSGSDPVYRPCLSCLSQHLARGTVSTLHNDVAVPVGNEAVVGDRCCRGSGRCQLYQVYSRVPQVA